MSLLRMVCLLPAAVLWATAAWAIDVHVADAPDSNLTLTVSAIRSAQHTIHMNIYDLSSPQVAQALVERIQAGVDVEVLEEGQPVGGLSDAGKKIQKQLEQAMQNQGDGKLYEMTSKGKAKRRYRFDHAKYAVIDGDTLLVGSENYSPTGNPEPGATGNRGWEALIHDPATAATFDAFFSEDADTSHGDVIELTADASPSKARGDLPLTQSPSESAPAPLPLLAASSVTVVTSPTSSLQGLVDAIDSATTTLDIEQMTFDPSTKKPWGGSKTGSPLEDAVVAAAERGVHVRVLLNDESVFDKGSKTSKPKNKPMVDALNKIAKTEKLQLTARIADVKAMGVDYIHNKGMLIDGARTLISSINWDETSVEKNRETAVLIDGSLVNAFYQKLFDGDWAKSAK